MSLRAPQSLHEDYVARHMRRDPTTGDYAPDPVLGGLARAAREARTLCDRAVEIAATIDADPTSSPALKAVRKSDHLPAIGDRAVERLEAGIAPARAEHALVQKSLAPKPPSNAVEAGIQGEVRARLFAMTPDARAKALDAAVAAKDEMTIGAVLGAPPMISGLDPTRAAMLGESFARVARPELAARRDQLAEAIRSAELGQGALAAFRRALTPPADPANALAQRAAQALDQAKVLGK